MTNICRICGNTANNQSMTVREMLFGTREKFEYFQCADCGCLQIAEIPQDMARHYPADKYYSYRMQVETGKMRVFFHKLLFWAYKAGLLSADFKYLRAFPVAAVKKLKRNAAILDVGCGNGRLIQDMRVWGWKNLTGIDPFIEKNTDISKNNKNGGGALKILKQNIFQHEGNYDVIMMHHSFEHLENPLETLQRCRELLAENGMLLIRIPVADCYVLRKYGIFAHQIDAPRHFFLHTERSMFLLANKTGFTIEKVEYESNAYQFINSEKYRKDIKRYDPFDVPKNRLKTLNKISKQLNAMHDGDMACFILKKSRT